MVRRVGGDEDKGDRHSAGSRDGGAPKGKTQRTTQLIDYVVQNFYHDTIIRAQSGGHVLNKEAATFSER